MTSARILIVDDDPVIASSVARVVARMQHEVVTVTDPFDAVDVIEKQEIDLVITDKDMPQMSGHMLLDILKDGHADVPCIMLTGAPSLESALVALNSDQVVRYLTKPWRPGELEETVTVGLDRRAALQLAAAARRADAARTAILERLVERDPELRGVVAGEMVLAPTFISDTLDDLVRHMLEGKAGAPPELYEKLARARPVHLAEALVILTLRNPTVGVVLQPGPAAAATTILSLDLRGEMVTAMGFDVELADVIAARIAAQAGVDPACNVERVGRLSARIPGATGHLVVSYQHGFGGASLEMRRVLTGADAPTSPTTPTQVGPYKLLEVCGQGGMGTVYRAVHTVLERPAAVKLLRGAYDDDPITVARFVREARAATRARHPAIVETYDFGHLPDGRPYLVMELVEAPTLQQRLRLGPLDPLEAVLIAREIADALAAAHRADVIHRDLKPANVFVDDQLVVKLVDFGAAKLLDFADDGLTRSGMTLGTPSYMSPEHITGKTLDGRTDIYALGCVLFEMLAGHAPYRGDARSVLSQHLQADVPQVSSPRGPLPPSLVRLVRKAMAKDHRQRHEAAEFMVAELDFVAGELSTSKGARRA